MDEPDLTVVLPMWNEAEMVDAVIAAVVAELTSTGRSFEIVCVNDGSTDRTADLLDAAAGRDPRVIPVQLSRNFGKEAAMSAGLEAARGRGVLLMDADLQHPPDLVHQLIEKWEQGFDVVNAVKVDRGEETLAYRASSAMFYLLIGRAIGDSLRGSSDFKLLDRQVVDAIVACPERHRFFRGLVAWVGFKVARVPFAVRARHAGTTKWSVPGLVRYSIRNLVAFSATPLYVVAWAGFATIGLAGLLAAQTLWNWLRGIAFTGFTTVILLQLFLGGALLLSVGMVAIYIATIYEEQKQRPIFLVRKPRSGGR